MFFYIRFIIGIAVFLTLYLILKRKNVLSKKLRILLICVFLVVTYGLCFLPVENLFVDFKSPNEAYKYYKADDSKEIKQVIDGDFSSLIIASDGGVTYEVFVTPKEDGVWKIPAHPFSQSTKTVFIDESDVDITIHKLKNSTDSFLEIHSTPGKEHVINDSLGSDFYTFYLNESNYFIYYVYVKNLDSNYKLFVDGEKIELN